MQVMIQGLPNGVYRAHAVRLVQAKLPDYIAYPCRPVLPNLLEALGKIVTRHDNNAEHERAEGAEEGLFSDARNNPEQRFPLPSLPRSSGHTNATDSFPLSFCPPSIVQEQL
jgi:hypothetical protein